MEVFTRHWHFETKIAVVVITYEALQQRKRKFSLIFAALHCEYKTEFNSFFSDVPFSLGFAQCERTLLNGSMFDTYPFLHEDLSFFVPSLPFVRQGLHVLRLFVLQLFKRESE